MSPYVLIAGVAGFGYLLPEFLFLLSPSEKKFTIPILMNLMSGASAAAVTAWWVLR